MTLIPNVQLSNKNPAFLSFFENIFHIRTFSVLCIFFAVLFYTAYRKYVIFRNKLYLKLQELDEEKNLVSRDNLHLRELNRSLDKKIKNYERLEKFTEDLNNEASLDRTLDTIISQTFEFFGSKANVLLYLLGERSRKLELRALKKEFPHEKVKEKAGDLFDQWVLRHSQPLLVEDASSDFRFDPERVRQELLRPVGSLIVVPLLSESSLFGILRVDSPEKEKFTSDDLRFLSVIGDIAKLSLENSIYFNNMQELSITDGLTGIFLRRYAIERLKEEFLRAERSSIPLSFLMLDLDFFKELNDSLGHLAGDTVLKKIAKSLKDFFDLPGNIVARYGGEEFCVILAHTTKQEALKLAQSFCDMMSQKDILIRRKTVRVTVSIGVASFPDDAHVFEDLIRCSDDALLKAKKSGRNMVCSF